MRPDPAVVRVARAMPRLAAEVRRAGEAVAPLLVSGPPSAVAKLHALLTQGGDGSLVRRVGILELERLERGGGAALVHVVKEWATPTDERALRGADRRSIPVVCLVLGGGPGGDRVLPYVLATDVVREVALGPDAVDAVARRLAARAPEHAFALAARLPALRKGVTESLVRRYACRNALVAAAVWAPGADLPALALEEIRLALRVLAAEGREPGGAELAAALAAAVGGGLALRGLVRRLRGLPLPAWLVQAAVAYAATRALGEGAAALARGRAR